MFADAGFPALAGEGAKQVGDPRLLPGGREGGAAARQTGAAGAAEQPVVVAARAVLRGEEAAVVRGAARTEGTGGAQIPKHAGLVALISHGASVAAVTGETEAKAARGGAHRRGSVHGVVGDAAAAVEVTWNDPRQVSEAAFLRGSVQTSSEVHS